jgi:hypothetical protein
LPRWAYDDGYCLYGNILLYCYCDCFSRSGGEYACCEAPTWAFEGEKFLREGQAVGKKKRNGCMSRHERREEEGNVLNSVYISIF